jgi:2-polyprenyl-3-methyl-5-hydroxy-6-metoxy-1,4-benzoquinol methylase
MSGRLDEKETEDRPTFLNRSWEMEEKSWWDLWNSSFRSEDKDETSNELFAHVATVLERVTNGRHGKILEIACGTGTLSRRLKFSSYHGLDLSAAAVQIAQRKAGSVEMPPGATTPTYEAADFHDWPLPTEQFDVVMCVDAISCFRDQSLVMQKMAQSVRADGYVILTTVNPFVYNRIRRADGGRLQNGPVSHWLTRRELHTLVAEAELKLERSYTIMPRGNRGILRVINSGRLDRALGPHGSTALRQAKERVGLGQYRVIVARKAFQN